MKKYFIFVFLVSFTFLLQAQTVRFYKSDRIEQRGEKQYYVHTVLQGQTVYSIAKAYNVGVEEIYFENPGTKNGISIDQELWIPTVNKETELTKEIGKAEFEFFYHIAQPKQTYQQLAGIYQLPETDIRHANPGLDDPFREGVYVKIPAKNVQSDSEGLQPRSFDPNRDAIPGYKHAVAAGETMYSISKKYGVSVAGLRAVNPIQSDTLEIGDQLRIPLEPATSGKTKEDLAKMISQEAKIFEHTVKSNETLYSISRQYGVSILELFRNNPGLTENINPGQVINIPGSTLDIPFIIYVADKNTRMKKVANMYNISYERLQDENPSIGRKLYAGQRIRIPVGEKAIRQLEYKDEEEEAVPESEEDVAVDPVTEPVGCRNISPHFDVTYDVALMVPLYLEDTDSLRRSQFLSEKQDAFNPFRYLQFYEGALIAVDSMKNKGMKINLHVFDVDQSITKTTKVLQDPDLRNMDIIIGPFHSKSFDQVALFAGNFNIPIVNPLTYRDEVLIKYPTAIKVKSDPKELIELVPRLFTDYYQGHKVFLITHTSYKDADVVAGLANRLDNIIEPQAKYSNNDLYNLAISVANRDDGYVSGDPLPTFILEGKKVYPDVVKGFIFDSTAFINNLIRVDYMKDGLNPFLDNASPLRKNLVILYGDNKAFMMDAMNKLNECRDTFNIQLVGLPLVEQFDNLDHTQANNLNLTYFATSHINYTDRQTEQFIMKFRDQFKTEPGVYGYSGYDITYFFLNALLYLDHRLNDCLEHLPLKLLLNDYRFQKSPETNNYQNMHWNLIRYQELSKQKLPGIRISD